MPRLGLVLDALGQLRAARRDDPVEVVAFRSTLVNTPRASGARRMGNLVRSRHGDVTIAAYAWHYLTHRADDPLSTRGRRRY